jgi:hypothetical protein
VAFAPGGRSIYSKKDIASEIENRKIWDRDVNHLGWWGNKNKGLDMASISFLTTLKNIKNDNHLNLKIRIEEPSVQIYAESESDLQQIVKLDERDFKNYIESISMPENEEVIQLLNSNSIIRSSDSGYKYKVVLRDGKYGIDVKQNILNFLDNIDQDQIKITSGARQSLETNNHGFLWGCYFYTNDIGITTFLSLIAPNLISNIHELVVRTNK